MIRPDLKVVKSLAIVERQHSDILKFLEEWQKHELDQLPNVTQNVALAQGRCQVLKELVELIKKSPDYTAKS
jgi:hypothetical protein